jgi:hypothetical protein
MGLGGQRHAPAALPPGKRPGTLKQMAGWTLSRSGRVQKISTQPGFDHRTVQPVASRYTDWAILANSKTFHENSGNYTSWYEPSQLETFKRSLPKVLLLQ